MANNERGYESTSICSSFSSLPEHDDSRPPSPFLTTSDNHPTSNFPPKPLVKSFSYNMLNAGAPSFLPKTSSSSALHGMSKSKRRPPPISLPGMPPMQKTNFFIPQPSGPPSPMTMGGPPSPMRMTGPPSPMRMMTGPPSPMRMMTGPPSPMRMTGPPSPITLAGTTTTQKTSFVIPQAHGPPTLLHVFTTTTSLPSPTSPGSAMFASGNFGAAVALSPRPLSPAVVAALSMPPQVHSAKEAGEVAGRKDWLLDEVSRKVIHQVEYYFSDLNVATTDHLIRFMNKDPEGYVPISAVASFKKIRNSTTSNAQLANILRNSEKLIVSDDGERVKRVIQMTESYMEELKSRIVVAEHLPHDHCHQNLMRIFSAVGSIKAIRTCQPSNSNGIVPSASRTAKPDGLHHSNKLHAFVEYESVEIAGKAVVELTDAKNWRNGLKVRFLMRSQVKSSPPRSVKSSPPRSLKSGHDTDSAGFLTDSEGEEDTEQKKPRGRGWGKGRGRPQYHPLKIEQHSTTKQTIVPRMPDGTRGFSMGRGKFIAAITA